VTKSVTTKKLIKAQLEVVPPPSDSHVPVMRMLWDLAWAIYFFNTHVPVSLLGCALLGKVWKITSFLKDANALRLYICTMSERDYALETWRFLDPEASLIGNSELLDRIVCVKPGFRKFLFNVIRSGIFHPKIAMVINDWVKVWEDKDQSRVHVVLAFAPYYAPLEEQGQPVPILCIARNVACNVIGGFFKWVICLWIKFGCKKV